MNQWINKASVLKDLMEVTQGEVHVNSQNFITTSKPQRVYVEEEVDGELQHIDPERLYEQTTPDLKAIPELLSMVAVVEEQSEEQNEQNHYTQENQEPKEIGTSLCHKEPNTITEDIKSTQSCEKVIKQNSITSPKHSKMLNDPASMFKKKASSKKMLIVDVEKPENVSSIDISKKEHKSSDHAEQLYREFKTKEETFKKNQETIWTKLYKDLEERDRKIISKQKENSPTQGADLA